jgi:DNA polymerase-3 subunit delta'
MKFSEVIGHNEVKESLIRSVEEGRISHAQLFLGPEGSGNLGMALAYVQYIYCENKSSNDSCGECPSCRKIGQLSHPDLHFSFPFIKMGKEGETADNFVIRFREAVIENPYLNLLSWYDYLGNQDKQGLISVKESVQIIKKLSLKSFEGGFKTYIIWMPEKLNTSAASKLLKTIEEPPEKTIIILVANDSDQLLPTIISRTQLVKLAPLSEEEVAQGLIDKFEMESQLAENLAAMSEGNFFHAKSLAIQAGEDNDNFIIFRDWMRLCFKKDIKGVSNWVDDISKIGRSRQKDFLTYALHIVRQCSMLNYGAEELLTIKGDERVFMQKFAPFINHHNLQEYIQLFSEAGYHIDRNANGRILFTDISYRLLMLLKSANQEIKKVKN